MYKPLTNNKLIVFELVWGLLGLVLVGLTTCSPLSSTSCITPVEQPLRGTWQGRVLGERDSTFVKFTFLPDHRFRFVILRLPAGTCNESSGTLMPQKHILYLSFPPGWRLKPLAGSTEHPPSLRFLPTGDSLAPLDLAPVRDAFTERAWALLAREDSGVVTFFYDQKNSLLLRFRADNFDIQVLAPETGIWGCYLSRANYIFIRPFAGFSTTTPHLPEGWYKIEADEHGLVLRNSHGVGYIFERRLF